MAEHASRHGSRPSSSHVAMVEGPSLLRAVMTGRPSLPRAMAREGKEAMAAWGGDSHAR